MRSARAYSTMALAGLDYKLHLGSKPYIAGMSIDVLHERNARRVCDMLKRNGGLYLKAGQAMAMQGSVLPECYQQGLAELFDDATPAPWSEIEAVIWEDFGQTVNELFGPAVEREPRAAASIAQVHYARLSDGREIAIKVQRRQILAQVSSDLSTLKRLFEFAAKETSIPMASLGEFLMNHVMQETDFERERSNSERLAEFVRDDPRLCDRVHIPTVYGDMSSRRVLTTEWIHGLTLRDKEGITTASTPSGRGLGLNLGDVMETVIELFSAQMFRYGFVHCDPHPGNIFVRRLPSGKPEIVLLDHGLYITLSESLRHQYAQFWKGLLTQDTEALRKVSNAWGMEDPEPWADALTMSSKKPEKARSEETPEERDERITAEAAGYFGTDGLWPPELVFLERNLGLVQGSNRFFGSPVNRIKLIGVAAMRSVEASGQETMWMTVRSRWSLFMLDLVFYLSSVRQYFGYGGGFEEDLKEEEDRAARELKDTLAIVLGITVD
ncbi:protein kinase-like protein [Colletotrichum kahawae]|uniref:Protein kinase-like protein n=1 Tax=Colletotrichum kahawae TaxID=34407 RepID=A0AAD9Y5X8_COLKA|nr:protein kinase-like protein [Colletotrichum kahawae]